jgi:hypothetical protein
VLHDMFAVPFAEIAPIVGRSPAATRQLASRARRMVQGADGPAPANHVLEREIVAAFLAASRGGSLDALMALLDPDVALRADDATVRMGAAAEGARCAGGHRDVLRAGPGRATRARRRDDGSETAAVLEAFEGRLTGGVVLALDRRFVHRLRMVTGTEGAPLNELQMLTDALMNNGGILRNSTVIKLVPEESVLKISIGDPVRLTADEFGRLAEVVFAEPERAFL